MGSPIKHPSPPAPSVLASMPIEDYYDGARVTRIKKGWWTYIVNFTSGKRTIWLNLLQGLYEKFPIRNSIR